MNGMTYKLELRYLDTLKLHTLTRNNYPTKVVGCTLGTVYELRQEAQLLEQAKQV